MITVLAAPFVITLVVAVLAWLTGSASRPRAAAWTLTVGSAAVALSTSGALALLAWPLVARIGPVAQLGRWRSGAVGRGVDIPVVVSALAVIGVIVVATRTIRFLADLSSEVGRLVSLHRSLGCSRGPAVVVYPDPVPQACAAPALTPGGGRTLISTGLIEALDPGERDAAIAHERAHLDHQHHLFALAIDGAVALNPGLRPVARRAHFEIERWADEVAADTTDRATTASAVAKTALARIRVLDLDASVGPLRLHLGRYRTSDRVRALLDDTAPGGADPLRLLFIPAVLALAAVAWAAHDMEGAFEAIRRLS